MRFPFPSEFLKYSSPILYTFDYRNVLLTYQLFFEHVIESKSRERAKTYLSRFSLAIFVSF